MVIVWSKPARTDLRAIYDYIAHDSERYAVRVIQDITSKVEILPNTPHLGKVVPEIGEETVREIGLYSYRIMHELINETIYILGVFHKRRDFQPQDLERE